MATNTEHYELIKPDQVDFYDVDEFNANADIVDRELKAVADKIPSNLINGNAAGSLRGVNAAAENESYQLGPNAVALGSGRAPGSNTLAIGSGLAVGSGSVAEGKNTFAGRCNLYRIVAVDATKTVVTLEHVEGLKVGHIVYFNAPTYSQVVAAKIVAIDVEKGKITLDKKPHEGLSLTVGRDMMSPAVGSSNSHAGGDDSLALGNCAFTFGRGTVAAGGQAQAFGSGSKALRNNAFACGDETSAEGIGSHTEGVLTVARGDYAHAEGGETQALAECSHAEGSNTVAAGESQHVQGKYNVADEANAYAHIVGNGETDNARSNAHTLDWQGNAWFAGEVTIGPDNQPLAKANHNHDAAYDAKGAAAAVEGKLTTHAGDSVKHITATERTAWNGKAAASDLTAHTGNKANPHGVTAAQVGAAASSHSHDAAYDAKGAAAAVEGKLTTHAGDSVKHITATERTAWNGKAAASDLTAHTGNKANPHGVTAAQVGAAASSHSHTAAQVGAVPTSRTVNGKALSGNITLTAADVGAASESGTKIYYTVTERPAVQEKATPLSSGRSLLAAATDGNGNVLFGGGTSGNRYYSSRVDQYSPSGTLTTLTELSTTRDILAAATDGNGNVLFGGGQNSSNQNTVDRYSPSGTRTTLTALSTTKYGLAAATDGNGNVLFGGGQTSSTGQKDTVDKYSPSGTRTTLTALSVARGFLAAATDGNGNVLFGGGATYNTSSNNYVASDSVDKYSPSGTRTTLTALSIARYDLAAATDGNGNVLFGGGQKNDSGNNTVDKYSPSGTRTTLTALSISRYDLAAATDGQGNVLFGGGSGTTYYYSTVDKYSPSGTRTTLTGLSKGRSTLAAATDGMGNVLFGGGYNGENSNLTSSYVTTVDKYNICASIPVLAGMKYKFKEHSAEQTAQTDTIVVTTPNSGYIKMGGSVTI